MRVNTQVKIVSLEKDRRESFSVNGKKHFINKMYMEFRSWTISKSTHKQNKKLFSPQNYAQMTNWKLIPACRNVTAREIRRENKSSEVSEWVVIFFPGCVREFWCLFHSHFLYLFCTIFPSLSSCAIHKWNFRFVSQAICELKSLRAWSMGNCYFSVAAFSSSKNWVAIANVVKVKPKSNIKIHAQTLTLAEILVRNCFDVCSKSTKVNSQRNPRFSELFCAIVFFFWFLVFSSFDC